MSTTNGQSDLNSKISLSFSHSISSLSAKANKSSTKKRLGGEVSRPSTLRLSKWVIILLSWINKNIERITKEIKLIMRVKSWKLLLSKL